MNDAKASTELLPKPKRSDYRASPNAGELFQVHEHDYAFLLDERDYYKRLAEFAIEALERAQQKINGGDNYVLPDIEKALSTIKGSQS